MIQVRASVDSNESMRALGPTEDSYVLESFTQEHGISTSEEQAKGHDSDGGNKWTCCTISVSRLSRRNNGNRRFQLWFTWDRGCGTWHQISDAGCETWGCPYHDTS